MISVCAHLAKSTRIVFPDLSLSPSFSRHADAGIRWCAPGLMAAGDYLYIDLSISTCTHTHRHVQMNECMYACLTAAQALAA